MYDFHDFLIELNYKSKLINNKNKFLKSLKDGNLCFVALDVGSVNCTGLCAYFISDEYQLFKVTYPYLMRWGFIY